MNNRTMKEPRIANSEEPPALASTPLGDQAVIAFLEKDPQFFDRHPDLTARLRLPHGAHGTVSLVERQMEVLRSQLDTERRRLAHFIERAHEYETLSAQLHALVLQLIAAPDFERIEAILCEALRKEFDTEAVTLKCFAVGGDANASEPLVSDFLGFADRKHALCGPLDTKRATLLFGKEGKEIQSAALIPIHGTMRTGVLAIGSVDPERFGQDMGTKHLDRLGQVVSRRLETLDRSDV